MGAWHCHENSERQRCERTRIANAGPAIYDVKHFPILPQTNENVVVTARAMDRQGLSAMTVRYRVDPNPNYTDVPMSDGGNDGDAIAGDGIYSARIPGQPDGEMVAFYVQGRDSLNALAHSAGCLSQTRLRSLLPE